MTPFCKLHNRSLLQSLNGSLPSSLEPTAFQNRQLLSAGHRRRNWSQQAAGITEWIKVAFKKNTPPLTTDPPHSDMPWLSGEMLAGNFGSFERLQDGRGGHPDTQRPEPQTSLVSNQSRQQRQAFTDGDACSGSVDAAEQQSAGFLGDRPPFGTADESS